MKHTAPPAIQHIEEAIHVIRGQKVMLDSDLAELYGVLTKNLNKAVARNVDRFPEDFMFRLTPEEYSSLRFQFGTLKHGQHSKYLPRVFTEYGVAMLSSVLHSKQAIQTNIAIMRAFGRLRRLLASHKELARRLDEMEKEYDKNFRVVFEAIRKLMEPPPRVPMPSKRRMGFITEDRK